MIRSGEVVVDDATYTAKIGGRHARPDVQGVRAAEVPGPAPRPGLQPPAAAAGGVGLRLLRRHPHRRRARTPAARQARPRERDADRHGPQRGLPVRAPGQGASPTSPPPGAGGTGRLTLPSSSTAVDESRPGGGRHRGSARQRRPRLRLRDHARRPARPVARGARRTSEARARPVHPRRRIRSDPLGGPARRPNTCSRRSRLSLRGTCVVPQQAPGGVVAGSAPVVAARPRPPVHRAGSSASAPRRAPPACGEPRRSAHTCRARRGLRPRVNAWTSSGSRPRPERGGRRRPPRRGDPAGAAPPPRAGAGWSRDDGFALWSASELQPRRAPRRPGARASAGELLGEVLAAYDGRSCAPGRTATTRRRRRWRGRTGFDRVRELWVMRRATADAAARARRPRRRSPSAATSRATRDELLRVNAAAFAPTPSRARWTPRTWPSGWPRRGSTPPGCWSPIDGRPDARLPLDQAALARARRGVRRRHRPGRAGPGARQGATLAGLHHLRAAASTRCCCTSSPTTRRRSRSTPGSVQARRRGHPRDVRR